jgi:5'-3' exonuclease
VRGVGAKTALALVNAYGSLDDLLADAAQVHPRPGPLKGKPALRARILEATDYIAAMRRLVPVNSVAPLTVWSGVRDDAALKTFADEHGLKGPVQRLLAALDSASAA